MARKVASDPLVQCFIKLHEDDLSQSVLRPVFTARHWDSADFHGGPGEGGKDIVLWRIGVDGMPEVGVVQAKKLRLSASANAPKGFPGLLSQLNQARTRPIPHTTGASFKPRELIFVTPYPVDTRALESGAEWYRELGVLGVKIVDGAQLAHLVRQLVPHLVPNLLGTQEAFAEAVRADLTNATLMKALRSNAVRYVSDIYTDLDLDLGTRRTLVLTEPSLPGSRVAHELELSDVPRLLQRADEVRVALGATLLVEPAEQVMRLSNAVEAGLEAWQKRQTSLAQAAKAARAEERRAEKALQRVGRSELTRPGPEASSDDKLAWEREQALKGIVGVLSSADTKKLKSMLKGGDLARGQARADELLGAATALLRARDGAERSDSALILHEAREPARRIAVTLDGPSLQSAFERVRRDVKERVAALNGRGLGVVQIGEHLHAIQQSLLQTEDILRTPGVSSASGYAREQVVRTTGQALRITLPVHQILDAGVSLAILGEAGAGKTTTLQSYADAHLMRSVDRQVLFLPLTEVISRRERAQDRRPGAARLIEAIASWLQARHRRDARRELEYALAHGGWCLLLDGVDEVLGAAPWILGAVAELAERFPRCQVVVSSRVVERVLDALTLPAVQLLPFTDVQCRTFVERWFGPESKTMAQHVLRHIGRSAEIRELARAPLVLTLLCHLASAERSLPESELRLHDERLRLLLGDYDIQKEVSRVASSRHALEVVARKVAYVLHAQHVRYAGRGWCKQKTYEGLGGRYSRDEVDRAVDELISPCDVLVPMSGDAAVGFGHLSFQEYLVGQELALNRNVDVLPLLGDPWWHGALTFFARTQESLEWLLEYVAERGLVLDSLAGLERMIRQSSPALRELQWQHLQSIAAAERFEGREGGSAEGVWAPDDDEWDTN